MIGQGAVDVKLDMDLLDSVVLSCKLNGSYYYNTCNFSSNFLAIHEILFLHCSFPRFNLLIVSDARRQWY
jgi:hypothetical protein